MREALVELLAARRQVRRYGVLVDQAVAAWHTRGEPPGWLARAVAGAERATVRVDAARWPSCATDCPDVALITE